jgi:hypothetical protein
MESRVGYLETYELLIYDIGDLHENLTGADFSRLAVQGQVTY